MASRCMSAISSSGPKRVRPLLRTGPHPKEPVTSHRCTFAVFLLLTLTAAGCSSSPTPGEAPRAEYDNVGQLRQLVFDASRNGRNDAVAETEGFRIASIAVDLDEDGKVDRWDFYDEERQLEKMGFSRSKDGTMDAVVYFARDGTVERAEVSPEGDAHAVAEMARRAVGLGRPDSTELTAQAVRDALTVAAGRIGARWLVPVEQPVVPSN